MNDIIFTNGCFDILHIGHVKLLEYCATLGEVVVGLNSDLSVQRLKGPSRPINNQEDRKQVLESLRSVSRVVIFEEETPLKIIYSLRPRVIVKGGDYLANDVVGNEIAEVRIFPLVEGLSTTKIFNTLSQEWRE